MTVWLTILGADVKFLTAILVGLGRPRPAVWSCGHVFRLGASGGHALPNFENSVNSVEKPPVFLRSLCLKKHLAHEAVDFGVVEAAFDGIGFFSSGADEDAAGGVAQGSPCDDKWVGNPESVGF